MKSKIIVALLIMNMVISASAQNQNQYGLVYRDAVSENVVGKVNIHPIVETLSPLNPKTLYSIFIYILSERKVGKKYLHRCNNNCGYKYNYFGFL